MKKAAFVGALVALPLSSFACSVCIAHALGAALHGLGAQTLERGHSVVGLTYLSFSKSNGTEGGRESELYRQVSLDAFYGLTNELMVGASVPYVFKRLEEGGESNDVSGLGDASLSVTYQLPVRETNAVVTAFTLTGKFPTGDNNRRDSSGARAEQHQQLGTGSTDATFGVLFTCEDPRHQGNLWYAGLQYRWNGSNSQGFRYGDVFFYDLGYAFKLGDADQMALEWVGRVAKKDRDNGLEDGNSGGHVGYGSVSLRHSLGGGYGAALTVQVPVLRRLNGDQTERTVFGFSVSRSF